MCLSDRAVSLQKQFVALLILMVLVGTIFNWTMKAQERNLARIQKHADFRVQQVKDEYERKLEEKEELFHQSWTKHTKEMELECKERLENLQKETELVTIAVNSSKDRENKRLQEINEKLALENEDMLRKWKNITTYMEKYKLETNQIELNNKSKQDAVDSLERNETTVNTYDFTSLNKGVATDKPQTKVVKVEVSREEQT